MRLVDGFYIRTILDERVAIPTGASAARLSGLVSMNETGEFLFNLLKEEQTRESLVQALLSSYEVERDIAERDTDSILAVLRENNLLIEA